MKNRHLLLLCAIVIALMVNTISVFAASASGKATFMTPPVPAPGEEFLIAIEYWVPRGSASFNAVTFSMTTSSGIGIDSITSTSGWTNGSSAPTKFASFSNGNATTIRISVSGTVNQNASEDQSLRVGTATITMSDNIIVYVDALVCGISLTLPHTHDMKESSRVDAACTTSGSITLQCTGCEYLEQVTIPALNHDRQETRVEPTCEKTGSLLVECQRVGCDFVLIEPLGKVPCKYGPDINETATCLTGGLDAERSKSYA